jgi:arylsulfatase A-like enzyme
VRQHTEIRASDLFAMALVLGIVSGFFEGAVHMVLQRYMLGGVWYQIIWIAAVFNALLLVAMAAALSALLTFRAVRSRGRHALVFLLVFAAWLPCITLMLKAWIHPVAILLLALGTTMAVTRTIRSHEQQALTLFRRGVPIALAVLLAACALIEGGFAARERLLTGRLRTAPDGSPDVLLVILDTVRADHLSSYGYEGSPTPNLDRLARQGVLFEQAFSTSSWTLPAHVSMLTGLFPHEHRVEWLTSKTWGSAPFRTLPEMLQDRGYRTAAFSGNTVWFSREHGFGRGFLHFEDFFHSPIDMVMRTAYGRIVARTVFPRLGVRDIPGRKRAEDTNRALLEWFDRGPERPAFVTVNYFDAHDPYMPTAEYAAGLATPRGLINSTFGIPEHLTPDDVAAEVAAYDATIRYTDAQLGRLLDTLNQRRRRDLLVVVTSDHGEEFGEHGGYGHGNHLYRETVHVPLIVWHPGSVPSGRRVVTPASIASIPATILELVGSAVPERAAPSLVPLWGAEPPAAWPEPRLELVHRPWDEENVPVRLGSLRSLVKWPWHFIDHETLGPELYDMVRDGLERHNEAPDPQNQPLIDGFRSRLAAAHPAARKDGSAPATATRSQVPEEGKGP